MTLKNHVGPAAVLLLALTTPIFPQSGFYGQDRNGDGVITRDEWSGSSRSFRQHDTNEDGVLSGNELPASMRTPRQSERAGDYQYRNNDPNRYNDSRNNDPNRYNDSRYNDRNSYDDRNQYNNRTDGYQERSRTVTGQNALMDQLDKNRNGVVEGNEWSFDANVFHQLDRNHDSVLSADELRNAPPDLVRSADTATIDQLDKNRNGVVEGSEWPFDAKVFHQLDRNHDSVLSADELPGQDRSRNGDRRR